MGRSDDKLEDLLHHPELWRAGQLGRSPEVVPSGFPALDEHLPGGGWPRGALAELLLPTAGIGELRLLIPLMRALSTGEARWVAWINPPFVPYAPALRAFGVDVHKILLIHPRDHRQALWALERASRGGTCSLALAWLDERQLELKDTRRLQLAARRGRTLTCLFRPVEAAAVNSMAELRLAVTPAEPASLNATGVSAAGRLDAVTVNIRKRRGGWPVSGIRLRIDDEPAPAQVHEQLELWRRRRGRHDPAGGGGEGRTGPFTHPGLEAPAGDDPPRVMH